MTKPLQNEIPKKPWYQAVFRGIGFILLGVMASGALLDALSNAIAIVTPMWTYFGSVTTFIVWVGIEIFLRIRPLSWIAGNKQKILLKSLGIKTRLAIFGTIILLWFPRLYPTAPSLPEQMTQTLGQTSLANSPTPSPTQQIPTPTPASEGARTRTQTQAIHKPIDLELAPFVLVERKRYKVSGEEINHIDYGLTTYLRVHNTSSQVLRIKAMEIVGDVSVDYNTFSSAFLKDGQQVFDLEETFNQKKPFIRLSWISWPHDDGKLEANDERYIRFIICPPANLGMVIYSGDRDRQNYFGFFDGSKTPDILTTSASVSNLVYFTAISGDRKQWLGPRFRDEVATGKVQFHVRWDSGSGVVPASAIRPIRLISKNDWEKSLPQELFYATDIWNRAAVKQAPLVKTPK